MLTRSTSYTCATNNIYHLFLKERPSIERALFLFRRHAHISGEQTVMKIKKKYQTYPASLQTVSFYQLRACSSPLCQPSSPLRYTESLSPWTWESRVHGRSQVRLFIAAHTHLVWVGGVSLTEKLSLVLPGFVFEVINSFHEESDTEHPAVTVFKQQTERKHGVSYFPLTFWYSLVNATIFIWCLKMLFVQ